MISGINHLVIELLRKVLIKQINFSKSYFLMWFRNVFIQLLLMLIVRWKPLKYQRLTSFKDDPHICEQLSQEKLSELSSNWFKRRDPRWRGHLPDNFYSTHLRKFDRQIFVFFVLTLPSFLPPPFLPFHSLFNLFLYFPLYPRHTCTHSSTHPHTHFANGFRFFTFELMFSSRQLLRPNRMLLFARRRLKSVAASMMTDEIKK